MNEYVTVKSKGGRFLLPSSDLPLAGSEIYCADLVDRDLPLFTGPEELHTLAARLSDQRVRRLHASYWASPAAFLCHFGEPKAYFGSPEAVAAYYGDLDGSHLFRRWCQEYALASAMDAEAYTFHLIDYFPIDGLWQFSISRQAVLSAMAEITVRFLAALDAEGLLSPDAPRIELENAGWGLEYGAQTARDFSDLLRQVSDPYQKLRVAWDVNHLLHAVGQRDRQGMFFLPEDEITEEMGFLQAEYGADPQLFAAKWLEQNLLAPELRGKVACVHLSDCAMKSQRFFSRGKLEEPWYSQLTACPDWDSKEHYGEQMVLGHYDSHLPLGTGILTGGAVVPLLRRLEAENPGFSLLHELKNSGDLPLDLARQRNALLEGGF